MLKNKMYTIWPSNGLQSYLSLISALKQRVPVQMIFQRMSRFRTTIITGIKGTVKGQNNDLWESVLPSTSRTNLAAWKCINTTFPISRVPPVSANIRIIRKYFCLLHNANVQLIFSRVIGFKVVFRRY